MGAAQAESINIYHSLMIAHFAAVKAHKGVKNMDKIRTAKQKLTDEVATFDGDHKKAYCMAEIAAYICTKITDEAAAELVMECNKDLCTIADQFLEEAKSIGSKDITAVMDYMMSGKLERMACDYYGLPTAEVSLLITPPKKHGFAAISLDI